MNVRTFVANMNWIVVGDSVLKEMVLPIADIKLVAGSDGGPVTTTSSPALVPNGLQFDGADTAQLRFMLPMDYDETGDRLVYKAVVYPHTTSSHTTSWGLTTAQRLHRAGAVPDATTKTAVAETGTLATGQVRVVVMTLGTGTYQAGDVIGRVIVVVNTDSTELILVGHSIIYGSSVSAFNTADRHRQMGVSSA